MATPRPYILLVDDDNEVRRALRLDMQQHYGLQYRIVEASSGAEALEALQDLRNRDRPVALILSDQRMPDLDGVGFLGQAKKLFPDSRRLLLTAYADTEAARRAINEAQVHYYLSKPWEPAEDKLFPVLDDQLEEWHATTKGNYAEIKVIGAQWSRQTYEIKNFLSGNLIAYKWMDVATNARGRELMENNGLDESKMPIVMLADGSTLSQPSIEDLAHHLGIKEQTDPATLYDLTIVGAGPAGLGAAVYGASEGLRTLLIEKHAPGGQAGTSSRIENYLGFPAGVSGEELSRRAITQAKRLGAQFLTPVSVKEIELKDNIKVLHLSDDSTIRTRALLISTGVEYRQLDVPGAENLYGRGVYYGAASTEALSCTDQTVIIVGGGNSAGQAAMYLARFAKQVDVLVRSKEGVQPTMSQYLIDQIAATPNITIRPCCQIKEVFGADHLESVCIENSDTSQRTTEAVAAVFIFIGTRPVTGWIPLNIFKDDKGFLETGGTLLQHENFRQNWHLERDPYFLETCVAGVFAAGDVRAGAMNRVASAVGEGSMAVKFVHAYLAE